MKPLVAGIIGGVIGSIIIGSLFFVGITSVSTMEQTNSRCAQIFDNDIVPVLLGQTLPSVQASEAWRQFELEQCATKHAQWEDRSANKGYIEQAGWAGFIKSEQRTLEQQEQVQKLQETKSKIINENILTGYKINTECELVLVTLLDGVVNKFTFNVIQSEEFKTKYSQQIKTIQKYNDMYQEITTETRDASDAFKAFPPEVFDAIFEIMSKEISINPQLKPFVHSIFLGKLTDEKGAEIASEKTECGATLQKLL